MIIDKLVSFLLQRFRGKRLTLPSTLPASAILSNIVQKGLGPYVRGLAVRLRLGKAGKHLFLGRACTILNKGHLRVGSNFYLGGYSYLDCLSVGGVTIGNNVTLREGGWLQLTSRYDNPGQHIVIGDNVYVGPRVILGAGAPITIGDRCQLGANVSLIAENHCYSGDAEIFDQGVRRAGIRLGNDVWVGNNVTILDGVTIGDSVVIGAGSVVTKSIATRSVVAGVPAKVIKTW
jgi:acetyltransferase-like isoleucine patch superfamily enzyme